jgi:hypothetical protein
MKELRRDKGAQVDGLAKLRTKIPFGEKGDKKKLNTEDESGRKRPPGGGPRREKWKLREERIV